MTDLNRQVAYWDRVAWQKEFTIPLDREGVLSHLDPAGKVLDLGCGYGRLMTELQSMGFADMVGVDISSELVRRGRGLHPDLDLRRIESPTLPFADGSFRAVVMVAVLTCIPGDRAQRDMVAEIHRVLAPGGVFHLADFLLNGDERNQERYRAFADKYDAFGVFELPEGAVLRHHGREWLADLLADFEELQATMKSVTTMNGHQSNSISYFGRKEG